MRRCRALSRAGAHVRHLGVIAIGAAVVLNLVVTGGAFGRTLRQTVSFTPADFSLSEGPSGARYHLNGCFAWNQPGAPVVPFRPVYLAIPDGEEVRSVQVEVSDLVDLGPQPAPALGSARPGEPLTRWEAHSAYPARSWQDGTSGRMRGVALHSLTLWPVVWNPATGTAGLRTRFTIVVETAPAAPAAGDWSPARHGGSGEADFDRVLREMVLNPESLPVRDVRATLKPLDSAAAPFSPRFRPSVDGSAVSFVIITGDSLVRFFQPLADWKTQKGIPTVIRTISWIRANYPNGIDLGETIRRFIADAASRWGTQFVLLGGDTEIIPARYGKTHYFGGEDIPADMYYQCLDGNWDADGDATFGEGYSSSSDTGDSCDLLPDVWLGRAAVSDSATVTTVVNKILTYEKNPPAGYLTHSLMLAEVLFPQNYSPGDSIVYDGATVAEQAISHFPGNFSVTRMYENYPPYPGALPETKSAVVTQINSGYGLIQHTGHGYINTMSVGIGGLALDNSDASSLANGDRLSLLYSINCTSAAIDYNCIGEAWIENPHGGAVANVGSTRFDFPGTGVNYQNEFYRQLMQVQVPSLGEAFARSKLPFVSLSTYDSEDRWTQFAQILLGDPTMEIWLAEPASLLVSYPASVNLGASSVTVTVTSGGSPVDSAVVCVDKANDDYQVGMTDASGQVTLNFRPDHAGTARLTVTSRLARPFQADVAVASPAAPHVFASQTVIDDLTPPAVGNGDGIFDLYETVGLKLTLSNTGTAPVGPVTATLSSSDPNLVILDNTASYPSIAAGGAAAPTDGFLVKAQGTATDRYETSATLTINATGYSRSEPVVVLIGAPLLERYHIAATDSVTGNGDGLYQVGEPWSLKMTLRNNGRGAIEGVVGKLRAIQAGTAVIDSVSTYGTIASDGMVTGDQFIYSISDGSASHKFRFVVQAQGLTLMSYDIDLVKPGSPVLPAAGGQATSITLTWPIALDIDLRGYIVYRSASAGGPFVRINHYADSRVSTYTDDNLPPLTRFYYKVSSIDQSGNESALSQLAAATTTLPASAGFPIALAAATSSSPCFSYFNGDTIPEIVAANQEIYVVSGNGKELIDGDQDARTYGVFTHSGFVNFWSPPSSADIDLDGVIDVVAAGWSNGQLYVFDGRTQVKPGFPVNINLWQSTTPHTWSAPCLADVDGDGKMEIFINSDVATYAFHSNGTELVDGDHNPSTLGVFNVMGSGNNYGSPVVADINNDGIPEVIVGSRDRKLYVKRLDATNFPGFPITYGGDITSTPAIGDLNNDGLPEIIFGSSDNKLHAINYLGVESTGFPKGVNFNQDIDSSPALADLNGDGYLDVAVCAGNGTVYIFSGRDGSIFPNWPVIIFDGSGAKIQIRSSPVIGNVDTSPDLEIIFGGQDGNVYAYKLNGQPALGFPIKTGNVVEGAPMVWDMDGDGLAEVCVQGYDQKLYMWDTPAPFTPSSCPWPMFAHDSRRSGIYGAPIFLVTGVPEGEHPVKPPALLGQNWPNPFNPATSIRFTLPAGGGPRSVTLDLFDAAGRRVRRLLDASLAEGEHVASWDGVTDAGGEAPSGVYFYRLTVDGKTQSRKMVLAR